MLTYRLVPTQYAHDLSGTGSAKEPGRWNVEGIPCLYTSENQALAVCECLLGSSSTKADDLMMVTYNVPDDFPILRLEADDLPDNWHLNPPPDTCRELGAKHLNCTDYIAFRVPSSIVPDEYNYVLNPTFPHYDQISIQQVRCFDSSQVQLQG